ncbi:MULTISPECIES: aminopeptidase P family protein [unclassified Fusibacter]|uniref:aminopeptidase P family protein n=1 Tax=unclassified Fusibacter TaxID=2624464 RepID=UPI0013E94AB6|nr:MULTISPECIES: aminopeptidase P family protein [unclassified Fusibacter]MCK8060124.1 aminopeptidase P family protein [Fusibacter sp. A2]NPE22266.1 aminopeptidase P family protein [Fusibacter sp. A1]
MINQRVSELRNQMKAHGISCYIVPSFDAHQSEYVSDYFKSREWICGFTGSAGTAVITEYKARLWTDGRYHTQAETQLSDTPFELVKQGLPGEPTIAEWLGDNLYEGAVISFDGKCYSQSAFEQLLQQTKSKAFDFKIDLDLIDSLWTERPAFPMGRVIDFKLEYAGQSRTEKIERVRETMKKNAADAFILPNLDDIAWLLNIRGEDIQYCPFVISYVIITLDEVKLYVHSEKLDDEVKNSLKADRIDLLDYDSIFMDLDGMNHKKVIYDKHQISASLVGALPETVIHIDKGDEITKFKAVKSKEEIANIRNSQIKDGIALIYFLEWLYSEVKSGSITELDVADQLEKFRREQPLSMGPSFNTIAGYGENAAMMHYGATKDNHAVLKEKGFLLFDSGGQYLDGTTDITRTVALGELTDEERVDYTLTLKSHIGLSKAVFLKGTCGPHLDILARKPMWDAGLDYKCGTGHGLGYVLSVHEGPHTIRCNQNDVELEKGMLITNEPGVYKPGRHGVRIENTLLVVEDRVTEFGEFFKFETISYCPIDTVPLVMDLLTEAELEWINDYHDKVNRHLSPMLEGSTLELLDKLTRRI